MTNDERLTKLVSRTAMQTVWKSEGFPEEFEREGVVWKKDHTTAAENGEVQTVEYTTKDEEGRKWLVVVNE